MPDESANPVRAVRQHEGATVVDLGGEIDMHRAPTLSDRLAEVVAARPRKLVLNFADVSYIDSTGLGTLVYILRQVNAYKGKMAVVSLPQTVRSVFEITRLINVFAVFDSVDEAVKA